MNKITNPKKNVIGGLQVNTKFKRGRDGFVTQGGRWARGQDKTKFKFTWDGFATLGKGGIRAINGFIGQDKVQEREGRFSNFGQKGSKGKVGLVLIIQ